MLRTTEAMGTSEARTLLDPDGNRRSPNADASSFVCGDVTFESFRASLYSLGVIGPIWTTRHLVRRQKGKSGGVGASGGTEGTWGRVRRSDVPSSMSPALDSPRIHRRRL
jgi:hypothetical protein